MLVHNYYRWKVSTLDGKICICYLHNNSHSLDAATACSFFLSISKCTEVVFQDVVLGKTSLSTFGYVGALIEIVIIFYILIASLAGLYSIIPISLRPRKNDTDMTKVVYNCAILLILSSALPVLCRILGKILHHITNIYL